MSTPLVVDIKKGSLDDGPGIRSVVFFKGCPLSCVWCQNPESLDPRPQIQRDPALCLSCGACSDACPNGVARPCSQSEEAGCVTCSRCVQACPSGARRIAGMRMSVGELVAVLLRDAPFYARSEGGVTLSGGEPALYPEFAGSVAAELREQGVHVLLETCGHFDWDRFAQKMLPHLSAVYFDVKLIDADEHRKHVGLTNDVIQRNLERLAILPELELRARVPLVPGITDSETNLRGIAMRLQDLGLSEVTLLAYNPLWVAKRRALGLEMPYAHSDWMPAERLAACRSVFDRQGVAVA